jgi:hypothetical protein
MINRFEMNFQERLAWLFGEFLVSMIGLDTICFNIIQDAMLSALAYVEPEERHLNT